MLMKRHMAIGHFLMWTLPTSFMSFPRQKVQTSVILAVDFVLFLEFAKIFFSELMFYIWYVSMERECKLLKPNSILGGWVKKVALG